MHDTVPYNTVPYLYIDLLCVLFVTPNNVSHTWGFNLSEMGRPRTAGWLRMERGRGPTRTINDHQEIPLAGCFVHHSHVRQNVKEWASAQNIWGMSDHVE